MKAFAARQRYGQRSLLTTYRKRGTAAVLLMFALALSACGSDASQGGDGTRTGADTPPEAAERGNTDEETSPPTESSDDPIVIGAYAAATGPARPFGSYMQEGWALAEREINDAGGIDGRPVEIRFGDTATEEAQARSIVQGFVDDESVLAVTGPTTSGNAFASHPIAIRQEVPVVSVSNSDPRIMEQGEYVFRTYVPDTELARALATRMVEERDLEQVAIIYAQDDPYSESTNTAFKDTISELGVDIVTEVAYSADSPDMGPQIRQLIDADADAVIVSASPGEDGGLFLRQARDAGLDGLVIGNAAFNSPAVLELAGDATVGLVIASQWWIGDQSERNQAFVSAYQEEFGREPGTFSAMAYNGAFVIKRAFEAAGEASRAGLQEGLLGLDGYDDLLGAPVTFVERDATTESPLILMTTREDPGSFVKYDAASFNQ